MFPVLSHQGLWDQPVCENVSTRAPALFEDPYKLTLRVRSRDDINKAWIQTPDPRSVQSTSVSLHVRMWAYIEARRFSMIRKKIDTQSTQHGWHSQCMNTNTGSLFCLTNECEPTCENMNIYRGPAFFNDPYKSTPRVRNMDDIHNVWIQTPVPRYISSTSMSIHARMWVYIEVRRFSTIRINWRPEYATWMTFTMNTNTGSPFCLINECEPVCENMIIYRGLAFFIDLYKLTPRVRNRMHEYKQRFPVLSHQRACESLTIFRPPASKRIRIIVKLYAQLIIMPLWANIVVMCVVLTQRDPAW